MTLPIRRCLPLFAALFAAGSTLRAQPQALAIDPGQTKVEFTLGGTLHTVHGSFQLKRGTLRFDPQSGAASGELIVDASSGESGNESRDKRMHAAILESAKFPEITFRPDRVEGKVAPEGKSQVQLHGIFAIHGAEHEIMLPVTVDASGGRYNATAIFQVPYVKWGMKNPSTFLLRVNDKAEITIQTVARPM